MHIGSQPTFIGCLVVASSFFSQERGVSPTRSCCSTSISLFNIWMFSSSGSSGLLRRTVMLRRVSPYRKASSESTFCIACARSPLVVSSVSRNDFFVVLSASVFDSCSTLHGALHFPSVRLPGPNLHTCPISVLSPWLGSGWVLHSPRHLMGGSSFPLLEKRLVFARLILHP